MTAIALEEPRAKRAETIDAWHRLLHSSLGNDAAVRELVRQYFLLRVGARQQLVPKALAVLEADDPAELEAWAVGGDWRTSMPSIAGLRLTRGTHYAYGGTLRASRAPSGATTGATTAQQDGHGLEDGLLRFGILKSRPITSTG
jgi:hypothetical protein